MTPREPDRYEAKAREILRQDAIDVIRSHVAPPLADLMIRALRAAESSALERAAQELDSHRYINASKIVRALASPAAAPAAEEDPREDRWANPDLGPMPEFTPPSEPAAPAPPFVSDLVLDALQRCERARTANAHPPMLCVACAGEAARAARFPARAAPHAKGEGK